MTSSQRWRHCHLIPSVGESTLTLLHLTHAGLQYRISFPVCRCSHTVHKRSLNGLMSIWMMWILRGGISKSSHLNLKETYDAFLYLFPMSVFYIQCVCVHVKDLKQLQSFPHQKAPNNNSLSFWHVLFSKILHCWKLFFSERTTLQLLDLKSPYYTQLLNWIVCTVSTVGL